ncbi:MAG: FAD-dependent oxidoreductase [Actinomycetota bacterium]|nr:FAD-dependent oxidoreductase [Actinomycetota bacterium]
MTVPGEDPDLVVVGGGAAGLGAAHAAAARGARVLLVTDGEPGGECTFTGCVPSKALLAAAAQGLAYGDAARRVRETVTAIAATEDAATLRASGIEVLRGRARLRDRTVLDVDGSTVRAPRIVLATGSRPAVPDGLGLAGVPFLTNETVFELAELPGSLAVLGAGSVGCELAQAFRRLGSAVTVVETAATVLPGEEPEASAVLAAVFARAGIDLRVGARPRWVGAERDGRLRLQLDGDEALVADQLLVAAGRWPNSDDLGLESVGVEVGQHGQVVTDPHLCTTVDGIYAAGDVTGLMPFTHAAYAMGRLAAGNALASRPWRRRYDPAATPWVTFTDPEVARVGVREAEAPRGTRVATVPMTSVDRARTAAETDGFVKLLAAPRPLLRRAAGGRLVGATVVAARAGEMIHEPTLAMATRMFPGRLAATTHAYPTWSLAVQQAAAQLFTDRDGRPAARAARDHR